MNPPESRATLAVPADLAVPPLPPLDQIAGLEPIEQIRRRWPVVLAALLTALMIVGLGHELFDRGLAALARSVPTHPGYYIACALLYMSPPTFDWLIFRRLWRLPIDGLGALIQKRIANEVVFGYSGEAYFYAWARQRMKMIASPFGAVKDVSILSAIAGNAITLAMMALALPFAKDLFKPDTFARLEWSAFGIVAMSLPFLVFSRRVFSLPRAQLWWVFAVHCGRLCTGSVLIALAWHFALPDVSLGMWLFLAAGRLLVSRLPLVPNKDLLFANFAIILIGQGEALSDLVAFTAAITLLGHIAFVVAFGLLAIVRKRKA